MVRVGVSEVLGDAWDVYTLPFRRSVPIAALVYIFVDGVWVVARESNSDGVRIALYLASILLLIAGPHVAIGLAGSLIGQRPTAWR